MGMQHVVAQYEQDRYEEVKIDTWGHLAPQKGVTYPITFTAAVGWFSEDILNPILLSCGPADGPWYGPWFYESVREFISDRLGKEENEGKIFRFVGHWRNYQFVGTFKQVTLGK